MVTFVTMFLLILSPLSNNAFLTERYGSLNGGTNNIRVNIGRISGIKWGYYGGLNGYPEQFNGLVIKSWTSDSFISSPPDTIGSNAITINCTSFSLLDNQYIDGYRVIYDLKFPRLLGFHISNNDTYECNVTNFIFNDHLTPPINDTGWVIFDNYQLIGFYAKDGGIIDSIAFQFDSILTINSFRTNITGGSGGDDFVELFDIGRVNAIYKWGWNTDSQTSMDGIVISNWSSDNLPPSDSVLFGQDSQTNILCNSFQLANNEYIIGYRLKKANASLHIGYIGFISTLNNVYECGESNVNVSMLSWIIPSPAAYLSGISATFGLVIHSISFQFTYLPYNIDCDQNKYGACSSQYIECMGGIDCNVNCTNDHSCYNANISCPLNADCVVFCRDINGGGHSCQGARIDASMSSSLTIYAEGNHAAFQVEVITDSLDGTILNQIGNDGNIFEGINLYSINKWTDVQINCITNTCCTCKGIMFYGNGYTQQCDMLSDGTMCQSESEATTPNPTMIATSLSSQTTDIYNNVVINYGVIITVTFEYDFSSNDTTVIENILLSVIGNILNNTVSEQCVVSNDFDIKTHFQANKTVVNATIFVCDVEARDDLLVAIGDNKLEEDLVQKINHDTHLQVSQDGISVETDVIIVVQDKDMVTTTDMLTTKGEFHQNGANKLTTVYIVGSIILVGILLICLGVYFYRKYTLNHSCVMKDHGNLEMAVTQHKSQIIDKTQNEEKSEGLMDTNDDDEDEDMYDNNVCVNVTAGSSIMNVQSENEEMKKNTLSDGNTTMEYDEIDEDMYTKESEIVTQHGYDESITTKGDDMETMQGVNTKGYV